jgi:hypothetical protein
MVYSMTWLKENWLKVAAPLLGGSFGAFVILASLYVQTYSELGDELGYALREEPNWFVFAFGVFCLAAGIKEAWEQR